MTIEEVSKKYGYSISTIKTQFNRTAAAIRKKYGVTLIKVDIDTYKIDDERKKFFYEEKTDLKKGIHINKDLLKLEDNIFLVLLAILCTPQRRFEGMAQELLGYADIRNYGSKKRGIELVDKILKELEDLKYIKKQQDKQIYKVEIYINTDGDFWFPFDVGKVCRNIIEKKHMQEKRFSQLIKVWIAMENQQHEKPFGHYQIGKLTGLSKSQTKDACKVMMVQGVLVGIKRYSNYFIYSFRDTIENSLTKNR